MDFKEQKAIFQQIADRICDEIVQGMYETGGRVPSVREYAARMEVNANTCMRAYDLLQQSGIIYTKRGCGYFVEENAQEQILEYRRKEFRRELLPEVFRQMDLLSIDTDTMCSMYNDWKNSN